MPRHACDGNIIFWPVRFCRYFCVACPANLDPVHMRGDRSRFSRCRLVWFFALTPYPSTELMLVLEVRSNMPTVELIYDSDCPNVPQARENLLRAFGLTGLVPRWREWDRADAEAPEHVRAFGSPTVLIDDRDVADSDATDAACCRIYAGEDGKHHGAPSVALIAAALAGVEAPTVKRFGARIAPLLPAIGTAVLPKLVCPACWPAYAGALSALGMGFINYSPLLLPLTALFLGVVLVTLAYRAKARRGYRPFVLGMLAAVIVLVGKFHFDSDATLYAGVALLIGASLWNAWPRRNPAASCPACVTGADPAKPII